MEPRWVGDPIDVITGENVESKRDFTIPGPMALEFRRIYNHTWANRARGLGRGHRHSLDQWLAFDVDGLTYLHAEGGEVRFPFLDVDGARARAGGYTLERARSDEYRLSRHAQPTRVFRPGAERREWPLHALEQDGEALRLAYDKGKLKAIWVDAYRAVTLVSDASDQIVEVQLREPDREPLPIVRYRYDEHLRLVRVVDPYNQKLELGYDALHRLAYTVDAGGYRFDFRYDGANRCVGTQGQDGLLSVQLRYNPAARETVLIDANGAEWRYEHDLDKNLSAITDPYGGTTLFKRGRTGELVEEIDPAGRKTRYVLDAAGAQVAKILPSGTRVPLPEGRNPPPADEHRVPSIAIEWEYGDLWDLEFGLPDQYEPLPGVLPAARSVLATSESPQRGRIEAVRDQAGLLTREVLEDGRKRRYGYSYRGKIRRYRDFDGSDYKLETRSWDLPFRSIDPLGHVTQYDYTQTAELREVIDAAGNRIHYEYDLKDRITAIGRNRLIHDRYEYDGSDNLIAKYDGNGRLLLAREHDSKGRLVKRELTSGDTHEFERDEDGWVTRAKTHLHDTRFAWDTWKRKILDQRDGKGVRHRFAGEHLVETTVFGRFRTEYHALEGGTIVVVDPTGATHRVRRHGRGLFTRDYANGWSETAQYHPRGWCLAKAAYRAAAPEGAWIRKYEYSGEGDLHRVLDSDKGLTQHHHDAAHRLIGTVHPDGKQDTYRYTQSGSLLEKPGLAEATVGHLNQLRYADRHQFEYGVRQHVSTHALPDGQRLDYKYDARDQLVAVLWNGQLYWKAEYDAIGRRIEKNVAGEVTRYYWDADRLAAELFHDGRLRVYVYPDAFALVPLCFIDYASEDADPRAGECYALFCDQRGCPERVVGDRGEVVWEAYVEPYGTAHVRVGQDFHQPLRFPGHYWDAELGLHYNRFRYYSPWLGRYLQVDPIGEGGGWNVYAYPSEPSSQVDVDGLNRCGEETHPLRRLADTVGDVVGAQLRHAVQAGRQVAKRVRRALRVARRMVELQGEGHGPQRHGPEVTNQQLRDRALGKVDPMTGTTTDGVHGGQHACGRNATAVNSHQDYVMADEHMRGSAEFEQRRLQAEADGDDGFRVEVPLEDIYGPDYEDHVRGVRRGGSNQHPTGNPPGTAPPTPSNFKNGSMIAIYRRGPDGEWHTYTMYPNPHPTNN
ncbi:MAG: DUF6531 domain-containing protein [Sandaracinaceae bacterium]|nr:DUF6531 domain-containing protein [Sandaracinaceae bacterium]